MIVIHIKAQQNMHQAATLHKLLNNTDFAHNRGDDQNNGIYPGRLYPDYLYTRHIVKNFTRQYPVKNNRTKLTCINFGVRFKIVRLDSEGIFILS